jgi:hypothetical protein
MSAATSQHSIVENYERGEQAHGEVSAAVVN